MWKNDVSNGKLKRPKNGRWLMPEKAEVLALVAAQKTEAEKQKAEVLALKEARKAQQVKAKEDLKYERKNNPRFFFVRYLKRKNIAIIADRFACQDCSTECSLVDYVNGDKPLCPDCQKKAKQEQNAKHHIKARIREANDPDFAQKNLKTNLLERVKSASKRRPEGFALEPDWAVKQYEKQKGLCFYTGSKMKVGKGSGGDTISIDRVDSTKGYSPENCVLCCWVFNSMKRNLPLNQLEALCEAFLANKSNWNKS